MALPPVTAEMLVVFGLLLAAVLLFATEFVSPDITAITIVVASVVLEPWTGIGTEEAFVGFANTATITVAAMYMLSEGIHRTGVVRRLGHALSAFAHGSQSRLLSATLVLTGGSAGVVNNTPVVAVFIPMVTELADEYRISPSKLLLPLSYVAMLGGTLTLVGTSTNLLASTLSARLLDHPFTMFEFTQLGLLVLVVGIVYLLTVGQGLIPARVEPNIDLVGAFRLRRHLTRLYVRPESPLAGRQLDRALDDLSLPADLDVIEVVRDGDRVTVPGPEYELAARDVVTVRASRSTVREFAAELDLWPLPWVRLDDLDMNVPRGVGPLVEVRIPEGSELADQRVRDIGFRQRYAATILAIKKGTSIVHDDFEDVVLEVGETLLLSTGSDHVDVLRDTDNLVVTAVAGNGRLRETTTASDHYRTNRAPIAVAIVAGVVLAAALGAVSIAIAALAGVVAMVSTGVLDSSEAYDAVSWDVIFLLAGMIPLGIALENSGGAAYIAELVAGVAGGLHPVVVLGLFYLLTAVLTNVISNNATVVLMIPIAVNVAAQVGIAPFSLVLAVTFGANTSFLTPIGYQTNLMVYGPGGYEFTDFLRVGAPLQLLLTVVTTVGIWLFWGI